MKVYELYPEPDRYEFPDQMEKILSYLRERGDIKVSGIMVERLFDDFLINNYWEVEREDVDLNDRLLQEFAEWLNEYNL